MKFTRNVAQSNVEGIDIERSSFMIGPVKTLGLILVIVLQFGCETTETDSYNRRDLYSPGPSFNSPETERQIQPSPTPEPKPQFR